MKKLRIGVVGCGGIFRVVHTPAYQAMDNVEIVAVCDIIPERAEAAAKNFPGATVYTDYNDLIAREDIEAVPELKILASSPQAGVHAVKNESNSQVFVFGHAEYDADTLKREYVRDKTAGLPIDVPINYFPDDDDTKDPLVTWRSHANLLFYNWLNYYVYQTTPYDISKI